MQKVNLIKGLREIHKNYSTFFIDLWGVVHNGLQLNPGAIDVLDNLDKLNKRFVLMSNAPRPGSSVEKFLSKLELNSKYFKSIFTSGDAAIKALKENIHGEKFFHVGPKRDEDLFKHMQNKKVKNFKSADFILCTGLFDNEEENLEFYKNFLSPWKKIDMVCTNPDLIVHKGSKQEYCAGAIADIFKELGGKVIYYGKPYEDIYKFSLKKNEKILVIGDNLNTDIKGANKMGFDCLLITGGIHKKEFFNVDEIEFKKILNKYNVNINYFQTQLKWES